MGLPMSGGVSWEDRRADLTEELNFKLAAVKNFSE